MNCRTIGRLVLENYVPYQPSYLHKYGLSFAAANTDLRHLAYRAPVRSLHRGAPLQSYDLTHCDAEEWRTELESVVNEADLVWALVTSRGV